MEKVYAAVLVAQKAAAAVLVPGTKLSAAYDAAATTLREQAPQGLADKLGKNVGFAMHLELQESKLKLSGGCELECRQGMVFNVSVGLADLQNDDAKDPRDKCALLLMYGLLWRSAAVSHV